MNATEKSLIIEKLKTIKVITVTQRDINNGVPCQSFECPIALALEKRLRKLKIDTEVFVLVGPVNIVFKSIEEIICLNKLPKVARDFISHFDDKTFPDSKLKPFRFNPIWN